LAQAQTWRLSANLPIQLGSNKKAQSDQVLAENVATAVTTMMTGSFVLNLMMSVGLQKLWGNINVL
jgi:hypothetical protein